MGNLIVKDSLYNSDAFRAVFEAGRRGSACCFYREAIFIRMLALCAEGIRLANAAQLARLSMSSEAQCNLVWSACVEHGVLRHSGGLYSAVEWMSENGMLSCVQPRPQNMQPRPQNMQPRPKIMQEPAQAEPPERAAKPGKLRPNVSMTQGQVSELMAAMSEEEFEAGLDILSGWKARKGDLNCNDDYRHFKKWVIAAAKKEAASRHMDARHDDDMDWLKQFYPEGQHA